MNKYFRIKLAFIILASSLVALIFMVLLVVPIIGWDWARIFRRGPYIALICLAGLILGSVRIIKRTRPIEEFRKRLLNGEQIDEALLSRTKHLALIFPVSSALIASGIFVVVSLILAIAMKISFNPPFSQIALMLFSVILMSGFLAILCFYFVKNTMEPVVERLMFEDPDFLGVKPIFRIGIRIKLTVSFISLGILAAMFALLANSQITHTVKRSVTDPAVVNAILDKTRDTLTLEIGAMLMFAVIIGLLAARDLSVPLKRITQAAKEISRGEGASRIPIMTEDEIGELSKTINWMNFGLLANLTNALKRSETLLKAAQDTIGVLREQSHELSSISSEQSTNAARQAASAQEASVTSIEISEAARIIAASARKTHESAEDARLNCDEGNITLKSALDDIRLSKEHAETASYVVLKMKERSEEIKAVIDIIEEISYQINLLSINASLEAVGAGATGKRFKTVAQEIGRLAEKTAEAIDRIRKTINETTEFTDKAVEVAQKSAQVANESAGKAVALENSFLTIRDAVQGAVRSAKEIELITNQQATASDQMAQTITGIADSSRKLDNSAQRLSDSIENLMKLSDKLKEMANG